MNKLALKHISYKTIQIRAMFTLIKKSQLLDKGAMIM